MTFESSFCFSSEQKIAGVDEVGRGPLAGPVITAAVIIKKIIEGVRDSKQLSMKKREQLALAIQSNAIAYAYGRAEVHEIDTLNIHQATLLAMKRAVEALPIQPDEVLVDGAHAPNLSLPCQAIIAGDQSVYSIACASILAKVARDAEMKAFDSLYPGYGFAKHKGYPTANHREALAQLGVTPIHRRSYAPIAKLLEA